MRAADRLHWRRCRARGASARVTGTYERGDGTGLQLFGGIGKAFESRNFRIYWIGNFTHTVTVWVNRLAIGWVTWELTHSPTWLGIMAAANMLPTLFIGPFAGVTADRFGHRNQLVVATYIGAVIAIVLTVLVLMDALTVWLLLWLGILSGIIRAFNVPARTAMVSNLVERKYLSAAIGINSATFHGGNFIGPAIAGGIIAAFGIAPAFFAYAAGEIIAATSFLLLHITGHGARKTGRFNVLSDLRDGLQYTWNHSGMLSLLTLSAISALLIQPYLEMLPAFASKVFNGDVRVLAYLTASTGAGAMVGGLWVARRGRMEGLVRIQTTAMGVGILALAGFTATAILWVSMMALVVVGFCFVAATASGGSLIQNAVEPSFRARVVSLNGVINVAGPAFGSMGIGLAATYLGVRLPVAMSAMLALVVYFAVLRTVLKNAKVMEDTSQHEAPAQPARQDAGAGPAARPA